MKKLTAATCLVCLALTAWSHAQEKKAPADPSGTWRWELEMNGDTVQNVLHLDANKVGKVTGTLHARDRKMDVQDGTMDGDKISFEVQLELQQTVVIQFEGKLDDDKIDGTMTAQVNGEGREFPWQAKRGLKAEDVVGGWQLKIVTDTGDTLQPLVTISQKDEKLTATYANDGKTLDVQNLKLEKNRLLFEIDADYEGAPLHVAFSALPLGSKIKGSLEYTINGESGELDFSGTRKGK